MYGIIQIEKVYFVDAGEEEPIGLSPMDIAAYGCVAFIIVCWLIAVCTPTETCTPVYSDRSHSTVPRRIYVSLLLVLFCFSKFRSNCTNFFLNQLFSSENCRRKDQTKSSLLIVLCRHN